jgi:hypothetical protein
MKAGLDLDGDKTVGKKLRVHVVQGEYLGRKNNQVDGYRPYDQK